MAKSTFPFELGPSPERGRFLSLVLIVVMALGVLAAIGMVRQALGYGTDVPPELRALAPILPFVAGIMIANGIAAWGIWRWRRWGIFLLVGIAALTLVIDITQTRGMLGSFYHVAVAIVILLLARKKLGWFE